MKNYYRVDYFESWIVREVTPPWPIQEKDVGDDCFFCRRTAEELAKALNEEELAQEKAKSKALAACIAHFEATKYDIVDI